MILVTWDAQTVLVTKGGETVPANVIMEQPGTTIPKCVKVVKWVQMTTNQREFLINKNQNLS